MSAYVKKFAPALPAHVRHAVVSRLTASSITDIAAYHVEPEDIPAMAARRNGEPVPASPGRRGVSSDLQAIASGD
jgi:hypothetical protein